MQSRMKRQSAPHDGACPAGLARVFEARPAQSLIERLPLECEKRSNIEVPSAAGREIRERRRLERRYGKGRWRKRKGRARVRLLDGTSREAELHWYEATGIGRKEFKIKRYLD